MFDLSILIASTTPREISILQSLNAICISDYFKQHICGVAKTSGEAYRKARDLAPDLIIIEEKLFSSALNLLCENCEVLVIADTRGKTDNGNIRYCFKPIQIAFIAKKIVKMFSLADEMQLEEIRSFRRTDLAMFPESFPEKDEPRLRHPGVNPIAERRMNKTAIQNGEFHFTPATPSDPSGDVPIDFYSPGVLAMMKEAQSGQPEEERSDILNVVWLSKPTKAVYLPGERISLDGGKIGIAYRSGISKEYVLTDKDLPADPTARLGMSEVLIHILGKELRFPITVKENQLVSLIVINPCKTTYLEGEHPDVSKMVLYGKRANGETGPITGYLYDNRPLTANDTQIVFRAENQEIAIPIHVEKSKVASVSLEQVPRLDYSVGEPLDLNGSLVLLKYENGEEIKRPITVEDLAVPFNSQKKGDQELHFKNELQNLHMTVHIRNHQEKIPVAIMVYARPSRLSYPAGFQKLDITGGVLSVYYSDGSNQKIPMSFDDMSFSVEEKGGRSAVVTVSYLGLTAMFMLSLTEPKIVKLEMKTPPKKTSYVDGELFSPDGMVLIGTYDNGQKKELTEFPDEQRPIHFGDAVYPVKIDGVSVPVFIKVEKRASVKAIAMKSPPLKTEYIAGTKELDLMGAEVIQIDSNGNSELVDISKCAVHGFDGNKLGKQEILLTYQNMSCTFSIFVREKQLDRIEITHYPTKINYFSGEKYDLSGLSVVAIYDDDSRNEISDFETSQETAVVEDTAVTISYHGKTAAFPVHVVQRKVESISIAKMPFKTTFMEGKDFFSSAGGELLAIYNDGSTEIVPMENSMFSGFSNLDPGIFDLKISYGGQETTLPITIKAKQLIGIALTAQPNKTDYIAGEPFDPAGMKVIGIYDNGETKPVFDYQYDPKGPLKESDGGVMIFFMNCSTACKIHVDPAPKIPVVVPPVPVNPQNVSDVALPEESGKDSEPIPAEWGGDVPPFYPSSFGLRFDEE